MTSSWSDCLNHQPFKRGSCLYTGDPNFAITVSADGLALGGVKISAGPMLRAMIALFCAKFIWFSVNSNHSYSVSCDKSRRRYVYCFPNLFLSVPHLAYKNEVRALSQYKDRFSRHGIPMLKIRRSRDRLIFIMGIPILVRRYLYIETTHWWLAFAFATFYVTIYRYKRRRIFHIQEWCMTFAQRFYHNL